MRQSKKPNFAPLKNSIGILIGNIVDRTRLRKSIEMMLSLLNLLCSFFIVLAQKTLFFDFTLGSIYFSQTGVPPPKCVFKKRILLIPSVNSYELVQPSMSTTSLLDAFQ
uniref:Uncharacterized protein n=1 Tax=Micrurus carvalhoi TaxID=3147026 RepID=A0A2H6NAN1_9SAUR